MEGPPRARMPGYGAGSKYLGRTEKETEWLRFHAPEPPGNSHCAPTHPYRDATGTSIWLDTYMYVAVYRSGGNGLRYPRGTKPSGYPEPTGLLGAVRRRYRAPTPNAAALGVQAPAGAA